MQLFATQEGLFRLNMKTGEFRNFRHDPKDPGSLGHSLSYDWQINN